MFLIFPISSILFWKILYHHVLLVWGFLIIIFLTNLVHKRKKLAREWEEVCQPGLGCWLIIPSQYPHWRWVGGFEDSQRRGTHTTPRPSSTREAPDIVVILILTTPYWCYFHVRNVTILLKPKTTITFLRYFLEQH